MRLGAKASYSEGQINDKLRRGADGIEVQLMTSDPIIELFTNVPRELQKYVKAVHLPMYDKKVDLSDITSDAGYNMLRKVCSALTYTFLENKPLHLICHFDATKAELERIGYYSKLVSNFRNMARGNKDIIFCVENTTQAMTNFRFDSSDFVKDCDYENIRSCVDTTHAIILEHAFGIVSKFMPVEPITIEDIFRENAEVCAHLHIGNAIQADEGFGFGKGHGVPFLEHDDPYVDRIRNAYSLLGCQPDIVYEVREEDYLNSENYTKITQQLRF